MGQKVSYLIFVGLTGYKYGMKDNPFKNMDVWSPSPKLTLKITSFAKISIHLIST